MRLFIAIEPGYLSGYFKILQSQIPGDLAKFSLAKSFHLTLKFLGEVDESWLEAIKTSLNKVSFTPFTAFLTGIGFFPNEKNIKVIWLGFDQSEKIIELQKNIDKSLRHILKPDNRFHPHITLARVKLIKDREMFLAKISQINTEEKQLEAVSFRLIKSTLTPEGLVYEVLAEFPQDL